MRRIGFRLGVALITFCLGVGAARIVLLNSQSPTVESECPSLSETITLPTFETPSTVPSEPATIVFRRSHKNKYGAIIADFRVTNIGSEPLSYAGVYGNPD